jgi:DNA-binding NarL/FixJ family response regulator
MEVIGVVTRGDEAIAAAVALAPDVVLMDYQLPDQDGVAATRALKAAAPNVAVVLLTASNEPSIVVEALAAGASGYVTKHKPLTDIIDAVRAAAVGESVVSSDMLVHLLPRLSGPAPKEHDLTPRESEVLALVADGVSNDEIAAQLFISRNTVRNHVQNLFAKLGVHSRLDAVLTASKAGLLP